jgi:hypothetical protein
MVIAHMNLIIVGYYSGDYYTVKIELFKKYIQVWNCFFVITLY